MNKNDYFEQIAKENPEKLKHCSVCSNKILILLNQYLEEYKDKDFICGSCQTYLYDTELVKDFIEVNKLGSLFNEFQVKGHAEWNV